MHNCTSERMALVRRGRARRKVGGPADSKIAIQPVSVASVGNKRRTTGHKLSPTAKRGAMSLDLGHKQVRFMAASRLFRCRSCADA
jgi:hypothetical protein